ncbi:MAG: hypothetical protein LC746_09240 [Acidobacteria bacterium]|nr:hypothetical protein [Acidobacteriota bacterium]
MQYPKNPRRARARTALLSTLLVFLFTDCASPRARQSQANAPQSQTTQARQPQTTAQTPARPQTPSETVRVFYALLRQRRVREAMALSVYKSAIEQMSAEEFEELRPEFEKLGDAVPAEIGIGGEQISGDRATVFARISTEPGSQQEPIDLISVNGAWLVGSRENYDIVAREGKEFFFKARLETHHAEVRNVLIKIANAEASYAAQNAGRYADLGALTQSESSMRLSLRDDIAALPTLGYALTLAVASNGKSYKANAEPTRYGHSGRISFYMDASGIQEKDNGGKPYNPPAKKKS